MRGSQLVGDQRQAQILAEAVEAGLTQREVSEEVGVSQGQVTRLLAYSAFIKSDANVGITLTESRYRAYWSQLADRRVNGQHSFQVFLDLSDEDWSQIEFPIWVTETRFICDEPIDRAYLFAQLDAKQSARSVEDNLGPHTAIYGDLEEVDRYAANKATQGLEWYETRVAATTGGVHLTVRNGPSARR